MGEPDVNEIFRDFEYTVKNSNKHEKHKDHDKNLPLKERLRQNYIREKTSLDEKYNKAKRVIEEHEKKQRLAEKVDKPERIDKHRRMDKPDFFIGISEESLSVFILYCGRICGVF